MHIQKGEGSNLCVFVAEFMRLEYTIYMEVRDIYCGGVICCVGAEGLKCVLPGFYDGDLRCVVYI